MRIDLPSSDAWGALCDRYREALPFQEPKVHVQVYPGYSFALWEMTQSLTKLFNHKKTIIICEPAEPIFDTIARAFSEEGYAVKTVKPEEWQGPDAWLDPLLPELLLVLYSEDDPVTGRVYDVSRMHAAMKEKRVFRVGVSHAAFRFSPVVKPIPYEARLLSLSPERALLVAGERCRITPTSVSLMPWPETDVVAARSDLAQVSPVQAETWKKSIADLEAALPAGFKPYFAAGDSARVFDRAIFHHDGFDGSAVIEELSRSLGKTLEPPGEDSSFESTSACRWTNPRVLDWLIARGESETRIRGLVAVAAEAIDDRFPGALSAASDRLRKLQG